jgi:acetolactate synthase-1/2/3 large subunit
MHVYEAIVTGLEGIGLEATFGGAGENAASIMLALRHSNRIPPNVVRHEHAVVEMVEQRFRRE